VAPNCWPQVRCLNMPVGNETPISSIHYARCKKRPILTLMDQTTVFDIHGYMPNSDCHIAESTGIVSETIAPLTEV
jgi:hypothetical protein